MKNLIRVILTMSLLSSWTVTTEAAPAYCICQCIYHKTGCATDPNWEPQTIKRPGGETCGHHNGTSCGDGKGTVAGCTPSDESGPGGMETQDEIFKSFDLN